MLLLACSRLLNFQIPRRSKNIRPKIYLIQQAGSRCITGNSSTHREAPILSCRTYIWKPRPHVGPLWSPWGPGCPYYFLRLFGRHVYSRLPGTLTRACTSTSLPIGRCRSAGSTGKDDLDCHTRRANERGEPTRVTFESLSHSHQACSRSSTRTQS